MVEKVNDFNRAFVEHMADRNRETCLYPLACMYIPGRGH